MYIITQDISISLSDFHMVLYSVSHKNRPLRNNPLSSVYFINNLCVIQSETSMIRRRFLLKHTDDKKIIKVDTYDLHRLNLDTAYFIGANFSNPPPSCKSNIRPWHDIELHNITKCTFCLTVRTVKSI